LFNARDTVATDTPAALATSLSVVTPFDLDVITLLRLHLPNAALGH
jgi:hypothetical protein